MLVPGRTGDQEPAPAADELVGRPISCAMGFESVSWGFNSGSATARD
jgi:hypothetical protein